MAVGLAYASLSQLLLPSGWRGVAVAVAVGVGLGVCVAVAVAVGVNVGVGEGRTAWTAAVAATLDFCQELEGLSYQTSYTPDLSRAVEPGLVSLTIGQYQVRRRRLSSFQQASSPPIARLPRWSSSKKPPPGVDPPRIINLLVPAS